MGAEERVDAGVVVKRAALKRTGALEAHDLLAALVHKRVRPGHHADEPAARRVDRPAGVAVVRHAGGVEVDGFLDHAHERPTGGAVCAAVRGVAVVAQRLAGLDVFDGHVLAAEGVGLHLDAVEPVDHRPVVGVEGAVVGGGRVDHAGRGGHFAALAVGEVDQRAGLPPVVAVVGAVSGGVAAALLRVVVADGAGGEVVVAEVVHEHAGTLLDDEPLRRRRLHPTDETRSCQRSSRGRRGNTCAHAGASHCTVRHTAVLVLSFKGFPRNCTARTRGNVRRYTSVPASPRRSSSGRVSLSRPRKAR